MFGSDLSDIDEPDPAFCLDECGEDIVANLLEFASLVARSGTADKWSSTAYVLELLSALLNSVGGPTLMQACAMHLQHRFVESLKLQGLS